MQNGNNLPGRRETNWINQYTQFLQSHHRQVDRCERLQDGKWFVSIHGDELPPVYGMEEWMESDPQRGLTFITLKKYSPFHEKFVWFLSIVTFILAVVLAIECFRAIHVAQRLEIITVEHVIILRALLVFATIVVIPVSSYLRLVPIAGIGAAICLFTDIM